MMGRLQVICTTDQIKEATGRNFRDLENVTTVDEKAESRGVRQNMRKTWLSS